MALTDKMSPVMQKITKHMDNMLRAMGNIDKELGSTFDPGDMAKVASEVNNIEDAFSKTEKAVNGANGSIDDMNNNINNLPPAADNVTKSFSDWQMKLMAVNAGLDLIKKGLGAVKGVADKAFSYLDAYDVRRNAEMQLQVVMENQGNTLDDFNQILDRATEMQNKTAIGDTAFIGAAAELSTYLTETEAVMAMMDTFADYATGMTGMPNVNAKEAVDLATQLGKVLEGSFDGLTKKGFALTDVQKDILENGTEMERVAVVADVIGESWDGLAESMASTPNGTLEQTKNLVSGMNEQIGEGLYPAVLKLNQGLLNVIGSGKLEAPLQAITRGFTTIMHLIGSLAPLVVSIIDLLSQAYLTIEPLINVIIGIFGILADGLAWTVGLISDALGFIQDNTWLLIGVLSILAGYILSITIPAFIKLATTVWTSIYAFLTKIATMLATAGATSIATAAQAALNAALYACPLVWIIAGIIAVVAALIYFSDAAGVVGGIIFSVIAYIAKWVLWLATPFVMVAEFVANVFRNPAEAIKMLFINAFNAVLEGLAILADGIDWTINKFGKFFKWLGLDFGIESNIGDMVRGWKIDIETSDDYISYMDKLQEFQDKINLDDAFDAGFNTFKDGAESIKDSMNDLLNFGKEHENTVFDAPTWDVGGGFNPGGVGAGGLGAGKLPDVGSIGNVGSVDKIKNDVSITEEDLKYLKDIAKLEYVNKYTTAKVELNATFGDVHETADTKAIVETLQDGMRQSLDNHLRG